MDSPNRTFDNRKSFRCKVPDARNDGELQIGEVRLPVQLLDESSGGFAVTADGPIELEEDTEAVLHTEIGSFKVRVKNMCELESAETPPMDPEDDSQTTVAVPIIQVGLELLGEVWPSLPVKSRFAEGVRCCLARLLPSGVSLLMVMVTLISVAIIAPLGAAVLLWTLKHPSDTQTEMSGTVESSSPGSWQSPYFKQSKTLKSVPSFTSLKRTIDNRLNDLGVGRTAAAAANRAVKDDIEKLQSLVRRMPGVDVFTLPKVVHELKLTDEQQKEFRRIGNSTTQALQHLDEQRPSDSRKERSENRRRVFEAARQKAVGVLNEEQRKRWDEWVSGRR